MQYAEAERIAIEAIPVIDLTDIADGGASLAAIGQQMLAAAEGIGFFYISGHAIPASLINAVFSVAARFFAQPLARKQQVAVNAGHRGFIQVGAAKMASRAKPDLKESFIWGLDEPGPDGIPPIGGLIFPPNCAACWSISSPAAARSAGRCSALSPPASASRRTALFAA